MPVRSYKHPNDFKSALEDRLRDQAAAEGSPFVRKRMLVIFDRFLARIDKQFAEAVVLKGGLALELRLTRARTTKDVDLRMMGSPDGLLSRLQDAGRLDLGDHLRFEVQVDQDQPEIDDAVYEGYRFKTTCMLAGGPYGDPFGLDVAFGDPMLGPPQEMLTPDHLKFIGIPPPCLRVYPIETHIAEKLHAYTKPRRTPNSRVKDLPDLALLASAQPLMARQVRAALAQTFTFRDTHHVPSVFPAPNEAWKGHTSTSHTSTASPGPPSSR